MEKRLLIITQVVDTKDPVLSFFHEWIALLAPHYAKIHVICLREGEHALPANVTVHSLGKESGRSRIKYVSRFFAYAWKLRHDYGSVFVHMNEEYVLLGGLMWKLLRKPVYLWRNFHAGTWKTDLAAAWCRNVFCTSRSSYTARYAKTVLMPVGVDTEAFGSPAGSEPTPNSILSLGRIAPVKRIHVLIEALTMLRDDGIVFTATIYGDALPEDRQYKEELEAGVREHGLSEFVRFCAGVPNAETPVIYQSHTFFVNLSPSGMYDKTIFEAAAAGTIPVASSKDYAAIADARLSFADSDARSLSERLKALLALGEGERQVLQDASRALAESQSLPSLIRALVSKLY